MTPVAVGIRGADSLAVMNVLIFGPNGSGKGTQGSFLARTFGLSHVESGSLFRRHIADRTPLGIEAEGYINEGELVPDSVTIPMMLETLEAAGDDGWLLDGFPRNLAQAEALWKALSDAGIPLDWVVEIRLDRTPAKQRIMGRRLCTENDHHANNVHIPAIEPKGDGCRACGAALTVRADDQDEDAIDSRHEAYYDEGQGTLAAVRFFECVCGEGGPAFLEIDGAQPIEVINGELLRGMSRFRRAFASRHVVLPVVHVETLDQALRNTGTARDAGADGVFLIDHSGANRELLAIHDAVANEHADWWVGVNCLGFDPAETFAAVSPRVAGVWVDNAGIEEDIDDQPYADGVDAVRRSEALHCLYFGGVSFKYQRLVEDLETACRIASRYMDVVTTTGPGTGHAADVEKIQRMRAALQGTALAIASGITPENVGEYLPYADCFLVATGISQSFTELDEARTRALVARVRQG